MTYGDADLILFFAVGIVFGWVMTNLGYAILELRRARRDLITIASRLKES
jgi:uncharacterized membrane protein YciS (DUF1049 family)